MISINVTRDENDKLDITASMQGTFPEIVDETVAGAVSVVQGAARDVMSYDTALELLDTIIRDLLDNRDLEEE